MAEGALLESVLKRDRTVVLAGLAAVTALAWAYLFVVAAGMNAMAGMGETMAMAQIKPWTGLDVLMMLLMWAIMMVAMMLPSAAPMILLYAAVTRKQSAKGHSFAPTGIFAGGYLAAWTGFSLIATTLQWGLEQTALMAPMTALSSPLLGGLLLVAAGLYQATPLKQACLAHCRSPIAFLSRSWRPGRAGAFVMGLHHGAFCVGCCWFLMGLLFFGGVMNLLWVAAIAVFVLLEKVIPHGPLMGRVTGAALVAGGLAVMFLG